LSLNTVTGHQENKAEKCIYISFHTS